MEVFDMNCRLPSYAKFNLLVMALLCLAIPPVSAQPIFEDGFESANLSHSENGFRWLSPNRTSIVRDDQYRVWTGKGSMEDGPYEGRQWENGPASAGRHALRFNYSAAVSMSEQRFALGGAQSELWVRYWLRVPINFRHGTGNTNNKLFAIWMDQYEYSGNGPTVVWQFRNNGSGGSDTMVYTVRSEPWDDGNRHTGEKLSTPFISYPKDQGRWMQLVFRVVAARQFGVADGVIQMWRRWEGEDSFTLMHDIRDAVTHAPNGGPDGWSYGYLMGWANASYTEDTEFLLEDFVVSGSSLLNSEPIPKPPSEVRAE